MRGHSKPYRRRLGKITIAIQALALTATTLLANQAAAHTTHHSHHTPSQPTPAPAPSPPPDSNFGPTAPGVSAILINASSGQVIAAEGADIPRYPASLTKLMVLDLTFQALRENRINLNTQIPISPHAASVPRVKLGLQPGDTITIQQAILAMTTMSANDAATALGEYIGGGSEERCAEMMTLRAHAIGMAQTEFANASGLPNPSQITTARDLSILARNIIDTYPEFQSFFETQKFDFNGRTIYSNNQMLKLYPGTTGLKTGYTTLAKHNLITSAYRNGRTLIGIVLHEPSWPDSYHQMTAMLDTGFGVPAGADTSLAANIPPPQDDVGEGATDPASQAGSLTPTPPTHITIQRRTSKPVPAATDWTAQMGSFTRLAKARNQANEIAHMRGTGIPRVARLERHGKILYTAQLAGLTLTAAHQICSALAHHTSCTIIPPQADHMASLAHVNG